MFADYGHTIKRFFDFTSLSQLLRNARLPTIAVMTRTLYLVAYDVADAKRLVRVGRYFKSYRVAGQKSVPEIWVTPAELARIRTDMAKLLSGEEDRLQMLQLDPRMKNHCLGQAHSFNASYFSIT